MKQFEEALQIVLDSAIVKGTENIDYTQSSGRILAEDVVSDIAMPPFDKSAMDGFACKRNDLEKELKVITTIAAGEAKDVVIKDGECARIMTGAPVPPGADCVMKVEETKSPVNEIVRFTGEKTKNNIAYQGEDIREGDIVIKKGERIAPQHIAVMASVGWISPLVYKQPEIAVISTGDEIVEPEQKPSASQIRNSNGRQLMAQSIRAGAIANYKGIAVDDEEITYTMLKEALEENDIVLLSGGVSMGDFDFIPRVFERLKVDLKFKTIAVQPGKPTVFGVLGEKRIFGLPGNPVSSYLIFELFVRPFVNKMMGNKVAVVKQKGVMGVDYSRKKTGRLSWIPVKINEDGKVFPLEYHGSAHIYSLVNADGFAAIPVNTKELKVGELVDVRQI